MQVNNKIKAVVLFLGIVCVLYGTKRLYPVRPSGLPGSEGPRYDPWSGAGGQSEPEYYQMGGGMGFYDPDASSIRWPTETGGGGGRD